MVSRSANRIRPGMGAPPGERWAGVQAEGAAGRQGDGTGPAWWRPPPGGGQNKVKTALAARSAGVGSTAGFTCVRPALLVRGVRPGWCAAAAGPPARLAASSPAGAGGVGAGGRQITECPQSGPHGAPRPRPNWISSRADGDSRDTHHPSMDRWDRGAIRSHRNPRQGGACTPTLPHNQPRPHHDPAPFNRTNHTQHRAAAAATRTTTRTPNPPGRPPMGDTPMR